MSSGKLTILVGEDDSEVRAYLDVTLRCLGFEVALAVDGEEVIRYLRRGHPAALILLDIMMPNKDGWETLRDVRKLKPGIPVIMVSGMSSPVNVVQAIKSGATDFLPKPFYHEELGRVVQGALSSAAQPHPEAGSVAESEKGVFYGKNREMAALRASLPKVASSDAPVLIQGETGSGKEVLARQLHDLSPRAAMPFIKLNCAALPADLIESELFGYEKGAFTGALQRKAGLFELADGGTIFLDEIGDMDVRLQAKLLQVLQDNEFRRVGGTELVRVDVRLISATHRDLREAIRDRTFREDLYYRLNIFTLVLPPLRERKEDIGQFAAFLIHRHSPPDVPPVALTPSLLEAFQRFEWPGNIRQLENMVRKLVALREPDLLLAEMEAMMLEGQGGPAVEIFTEPETANRNKLPSVKGSVLREVSRAKEEAEVAAILRALNQSKWNRKQAAALLNIEYKALLYKMKKLSVGDRLNQISLSA